MIDLDPQCNLSQFWNPVRDVKELTEDDLEHADGARAMVQMSGNGTKILSDQPHCHVRPTPMSDYVGDFGLHPPLFHMFHQWCSMGNQNLLDKVLDEARLEKCNPDFFKRVAKEDNLSLLVGCPILSSFEPSLSAAIGAPGKSPGDENYQKIGLVGYIMDKLTAKHKFDVILLDVSPSNSALNQIAALSCDYILPPCIASPYSCGSVYGLLTSILPGPEGWLGKHDLISRVQWDPKWEAEEKNEGYLPFRLPRVAPKLLPILVTNYGIEVVEVSPEPEPPTGKVNLSPEAPEPHAPTKQIGFSASQFIYTTIHYVRCECPNIEGNSDGANVPGPKIVFEPNQGDRVIPFAPSVPVSMPTSEGLGRPYVELELDHFNEFYGFEAASSAATRAKRGRGPTRQQQAVISQIGELKANEDFKEEVALMQKRYTSLALWVLELLTQKRAALVE